MYVQLTHEVLGMRNKLVGFSVAFIVAACGGGGGGSDNSKTSTIASAPSLQISSNSTDVLIGKSITITWNASNTGTCTASGSWTGSKSLSGSEVVTIKEEKNTFALTCGATNNSVTVTGKQYIVNVVHSDTPSYVTSLSTVKEVTDGIRNAPYSISFISGQDNKQRVFIFPASLQKLGFIPGFELIETSPNKFGFVKFYENVQLHSSRAWTHVNTKNKKSLVLVDHGQEIGDYNSWPFGDVYIASDQGNGFDFKKISNVKAFNHSVAAGDITGDGYDDIVVSHMGVKNKHDETLHAYIQDRDGNFVQDDKFAPETYPSSILASGSGAVALGDLDNDGTNEIIQANYVYNNPNWGAFRIFKKNFVGEYKITNTYNREGNYSYMGAGEITVVDYDNDKDKDLIFTLEGTCTDKVGEYTCMAIEVYRNDGNLVFTRLTDVLLSKSKFPNKTDIIWSSLKVVDFNKDGYFDIYLEYGSAAVVTSPGSFDLGKFFIRNNQGKNFTFMEGTKELQINFDKVEKVPTALRYMDNNHENSRLFGFSNNGTPVTIEILAGK